MQNEDVMVLFKKIEKLKNDKRPSTEIRQLYDTIIDISSFLVYKNTKKYKNFNNYFDLNQEGFVGLIKAVNIFNYRRFPNFFIFANQWVLNSIVRAAKKYDVVYNPKKLKTLYVDNLESSLFGLETDLIEDNLYENEKKSIVNNEISKLKKREQKIIKSVFGIGLDKSTLRGAEKQCKLTYERIRQIKKQIIKKMEANKNLKNIYNT